MRGIDKGIRRRILALLFIFTSMILALAVRVGYLQFVQGQALSEMAHRQQHMGMDISPVRGSIFDRNGEPLAINLPVETVTISPNEMRKSISDNGLSQTEVISSLAGILGLDEELVANRLARNSVYEVLIRRIDIQHADRLREYVSGIRLRGVYIIEDTRRFYQNGNLAAHVIGTTGADNQGLSGVEFLMERYLKGIPGRVMGEVDARNREVPLTSGERVDPRDGLNVVLTIDTTIQHLTTVALERAIEENDVRQGGVIIVMDPRNGDILAMVSKPILT